MDRSQSNICVKFYSRFNNCFRVYNPLGFISKRRRSPRLRGNSEKASASRRKFITSWKHRSPFFLGCIYGSFKTYIFTFLVTQIFLYWLYILWCAENVSDICNVYWKCFSVHLDRCEVKKATNDEKSKSFKSLKINVLRFRTPQMHQKQCQDTCRVSKIWFHHQVMHQ